MNRLLRIGAVIAGILILMILLWEFVGTFRTAALESDYWYYQHVSQVVTFHDDDMERLEMLFDEAFLEAIDASTVQVQPTAWQFYMASWFYSGKVTHWFTFGSGEAMRCVLLTYDTPHLYQPTEAVRADCDVLRNFHQTILRTMLEDIRTPTPSPEG